MRLELAPFPERIAPYPKAPPKTRTNEGERRPPTWNAGGPALVPACLLPTPLREITTVSVAPPGWVHQEWLDTATIPQLAHWTRCVLAQTRGEAFEDEDS